MRVSMLTVDPCTGLPTVVLEAAESDDRAAGSLKVAIGADVAPAIAAELGGIEFERPCTHQLTCGLLADAGARIERVEIYGVVHGHHRVRVHLRLADDHRVSREARPSDALALALHTGAPIEVALSVLGRDARRASVPCPDLETDDEPLLSIEPALADLAEVSDEVFGKWKM